MTTVCLPTYFSLFDFFYPQMCNFSIYRFCTCSDKCTSRNSISSGTNVTCSWVVKRNVSLFLGIMMWSVLFLSFQTACRLVSYLIKLAITSVICWIAVMRVKILGLFPTSWWKHSVSHIKYDVCCRIFVVTLYQVQLKLSLFLLKVFFILNHEWSVSTDMIKWFLLFNSFLWSQQKSHCFYH